MRNISSTISTLGNQIIRQGIQLIVRREEFRSLCVHSSYALRWLASRMSGDARWHMPGGMPAKHMACCFALAKHQVRTPRVTRFRTVG